MQEWLTVSEYAKKSGYSRQYVYILAALGKLTSRIKARKVEQMEVLWSDFKKAKKSDTLTDQEYKDLLSPGGRRMISKALKNKNKQNDQKTNTKTN